MPERSGNDQGHNQRQQADHRDEDREYQGGPRTEGAETRDRRGSQDEKKETGDGKAGRGGSGGRDE